MAALQAKASKGCCHASRLAAGIVYAHHLLQTGRCCRCGCQSAVLPSSHVVKCRCSSSQIAPLSMVLPRLPRQAALIWEPQAQLLQSCSNGWTQPWLQQRRRSAICRGCRWGTSQAVMPLSCLPGRNREPELPTRRTCRSGMIWAVSPCYAAPVPCLRGIERFRCPLPMKTWKALRSHYQVAAGAPPYHIVHSATVCMVPALACRSYCGPAAGQCTQHMQSVIPASICCHLF